MSKHYKTVIKTPKVIYYFLWALIIFLWACNSTRPDPSPSVGDETPSVTLTEIPEEAVVATEHRIQTQNALTQAALQTFTPLPTITPTQQLTLITTLTAIPNSTPASKGAYFKVPSDLLGPRYDVQNAYYFDDPETGERYEFYAGSLTGSGNEETAQGVMVLRRLRFSEEAGNAEVISTQEYLTPIQVGPLQIKVHAGGSILLFTPLHYEWGFSVLHGEMVDLGNPPLARLQIGEASQLAGRGSFCWKGTCADFGIYTNSEPLVTQSPFTAHLHLPVVEPPHSLRLQTMMVSPPGRLAYEIITDSEASWSSEKPGRELVDQGELPLKRDQEIEFSLEPGYHVLVISAAWRDYGDVQYGFLIEVQQ